MVQISDLYVAFMLSGFPDCLRGELSAVETVNASDDSIVLALDSQVEPKCVLVSSGAC